MQTITVEDLDGLVAGSMIITGSFENPFIATRTKEPHDSPETWEVPEDLDGESVRVMSTPELIAVATLEVNSNFDFPTKPVYVLLTDQELYHAMDREELLSVTDHRDDLAAHIAFHEMKAEFHRQEAEFWKAVDPATMPFGD